MDGKSFLLITREALMEFMGLRLGPALKISGYAAQLRAKMRLMSKPKEKKRRKNRVKKELKKEGPHGLQNPSATSSPKKEALTKKESTNSEVTPRNENVSMAATPKTEMIGIVATPKTEIKLENNVSSIPREIKEELHSTPEKMELSNSLEKDGSRFKSASFSDANSTERIIISTDDSRASASDEKENKVPSEIPTSEKKARTDTLMDVDKQLQQILSPPTDSPEFGTDSRVDTRTESTTNLSFGDDNNSCPPTDKKDLHLPTTMNGDTVLGIPL